MTICPWQNASRGVESNAELVAWTGALGEEKPRPAKCEIPRSSNCLRTGVFSLLAPIQPPCTSKTNQSWPFSFNERFYMNSEIGSGDNPDSQSTGIYLLSPKGRKNLRPYLSKASNYPGGPYKQWEWKQGESRFSIDWSSFVLHKRTPESMSVSFQSK